MASQFSSLAGLRHRPSKNCNRAKASHGERPTCCSPLISRRHEHQGNHLKKEILSLEQESKGGEREMKLYATKNNLRKRKKGKSVAREVPRFLGLWHLSSAISHLLRKARAFYDELCCDNYEDLNLGYQQTMAQPYFSVPVLPTPTVASK